MTTWNTSFAHVFHLHAQHCPGGTTQNLEKTPRKVDGLFAAADWQVQSLAELLNPNSMVDLEITPVDSAAVASAA